MGDSDFTLKLSDFYWCSEDPTTEHCLHGSVELHIGGRDITVNDREDWTVSTACCYLLWTLFNDHVFNDDEFELQGQLIPHCGHAVYGSDPAGNITCPVGIGWNVIHRDGSVHIENVRSVWTTAGNILHQLCDVVLSWEAYASVLVEQTESMMAFYNAAEPKDFSEDSRREFIEQLFTQMRDHLAQAKARLSLT